MSRTSLTNLVDKAYDKDDDEDSPCHERLLFVEIVEVGQASSLYKVRISVTNFDRLEACPTFLPQVSTRFDPAMVSAPGAQLT